jgi:hypothetical protein
MQMPAESQVGMSELLLRQGTVNAHATTSVIATDVILIE